MLFVVLINVVVSQNLSSLEQPLDIAISGAARAPNLIAYLNARGIHNVENHGLEGLDARRQGRRYRHARRRARDRRPVRRGLRHRARRARDPDPRPFESARGNRAERVSRAVNAYGQQLGALRLLASGADPTLLRPLLVDEYDVSTPAGRSVLMLGVLTYFLLFATLTGGLHLAIDTTAGERERKSLEPLLACPSRRSSLLVGKMAATVCYMLASLVLTLAAYAVAFEHMPLEQLGMSASFSLGKGLAMFAVLVPFAPLGAALMTLVASFTKTYREAQTYLTFVLLVPTLPVMFATMLNVEPKPTLMWIPSLSQHLLVTS